MSEYLTASSMFDIRVASTVLLAAFAMSHLLALVYVWTHRGMSYSPTFVQTLVMSSVVMAMMMLIIGNNVVWGISMVGASALVRFRTNLRDSRDMLFVFAALVAGMAAGTRAYAIGALGTLAFSFVAFYLACVPFGTRKRFDGLIRYTALWDGAGTESATQLLQKHCKEFVLATVREVRQGVASEHVYHIRFRNDGSRSQLAKELSALQGLSAVTILLEDTRVEI
jgi:hypothetical protein